MNRYLCKHLITLPLKKPLKTTKCRLTKKTVAHFKLHYGGGWGYVSYHQHTGNPVTTNPTENTQIFNADEINKLQHFATLHPTTFTCPYNIYPPKPHFYIAKLGFAGVYLFFLFLLQNIDCGYSLEPPHFFKLKKFSVYCMGKFS